MNNSSLSGLLLDCRDYGKGIHKVIKKVCSEVIELKDSSLGKRFT